MSIHEDEAIVLRCYDLAEVDRLVFLFAREAGKLRGVASGAKRFKSGFLGSLEIAAYVQVRYFDKEGLELVRIKQCRLLDWFQPYPEFSASLYLLYMTDLLNAFTTDRNSSPELFRLTLATFRSLREGAHLPLLARYFEYWILRLEGIWPSPTFCTRCRKALTAQDIRFRVDESGFFCRACSSQGDVSFEEADLQSLRDFSRCSPSVLSDQQVSPSTLSKLEVVSWSVIRRHLEHDLKSYRMLKGLLAAC